VRVEVDGCVWVVSGDYKPQADQTCEPFELIPCDGFISECTFGLPVYRWRPEERIHEEINDWWRENAGCGKPSVLFAYSLGKAQRVLAGLDQSIGPIFAHGAIHPFLPLYTEAGIRLPEVHRVDDERNDWSDSMILAPPALKDAKWLRRFSGARKAFASGWMAVRGTRRRHNLDRGFVLSDHADWEGLLNVIEGTGAEEIKMTHGNGDALVRYLRERGRNASVLEGAVLRGEKG
jgi:putative mRNA 3-end processing factor